MSSIASQTRNALYQAASQDFARICASDGLLAIYRDREDSAGAGEEVSIKLLDSGKVPAMLPAAGPVSLGQATHPRQRITIGVPICTDATELVGDKLVSPTGGIYGLKPYDQFEVPGWAVGKPDTSTVRVTVTEIIGRLGHALYAVEVAAS